MHQDGTERSTLNAYLEGLADQGCGQRLSASESACCHGHARDHMVLQKLQQTSQN